jgi:hypothetical protein
LGAVAVGDDPALAQRTDAIGQARLWAQHKIRKASSRRMSVLNRIRVAGLLTLVATFGSHSDAVTSPVRDLCDQIIYQRPVFLPMSWFPDHQEIKTIFDKNEFFWFPPSPVSGISIVRNDDKDQEPGFYSMGLKIADLPSGFAFPLFWLDSKKLVYSNWEHIALYDFDDFSGRNNYGPGNWYGPLSRIDIYSSLLSSPEVPILERNGRRFVLSTSETVPWSDSLVDILTGETFQLPARTLVDGLPVSGYWIFNKGVMRSDSTLLGNIKEPIRFYYSAHLENVTSGWFPGDKVHDETEHGNFFFGPSKSGRYLGFIENGRILLFDRIKKKYVLSERIPLFLTNVEPEWLESGLFLKGSEGFALLRGKGSWAVAKFEPGQPETIGGGRFSSNSAVSVVGPRCKSRSKFR